MAFPTYGRLQLGGFTKQRPSSSLRTEMEDGYIKENPHLSRVLVPRNVSYRYTLAEFETFESWFLSEANGGQFFDWVDPFTGTTKQVRIKASEYNTRAVSRGRGAELDVIVDFVLEEWAS